MVDPKVMQILLDTWVGADHPDLTSAQRAVVVSRLLPAHEVDYEVLLEEREAVVEAVRRGR